MKTLIISLVLILSAAITHSQEVIELKETRVDYNPLFAEMTNYGDTFIMHIKHNHNGEFEKDPISFLEKNFNVKQFIAHVQDRDYDSYRVSFRSNKGELKAEYDREGNMEWMSHRFKNIVLPYELTQQIFLDNQGWSVVKNLHVASGRDGKINKSFYKVTMKNGKQKKNIKIDALDKGRDAVAVRF